MSDLIDIHTACGVLCLFFYRNSHDRWKKEDNIARMISNILRHKTNSRIWNTPNDFESVYVATNSSHFEPDSDLKTLESFDQSWILIQVSSLWTLSLLSLDRVGNRNAGYSILLAWEFKSENNVWGILLVEALRYLSYWNTDKHEVVQRTRRSSFRRRSTSKISKLGKTQNTL